MEYTIVRQQPIASIDDLVDTGIIDWQRTNGTSRNPYRAILDISSWVVNRATLTVIDSDLEQAPERDDWPGWRHEGKHVSLGRLWWNYFHHAWQGAPHELVMADEPDFYGYITLPDGEHRIFGDINQVSASAFALVMRKVRPGDLWISVFGPTRQYIIEWSADNVSDFQQMMGITEPPRTLWDAIR